MNKTRFVFALLFVLCLPLAAFAGIMDDAKGVWILDPKTAQEQLPFDIKNLNVSKNTLSLKGTKKGEGRTIHFTVKTTTATTADLDIQRKGDSKGATLRLEMKSKKELSIGELHNGKIRDVIYFKR